MWLWLLSVLSYIVADSLFIVSPILQSSHLAEEERCGCFTLNVFLLSCSCLCSVFITSGAMGCSEACLAFHTINTCQYNI